MSDTAAQITSEILSQGILVSWPAFSLFLALNLLATAAVAFASAYFSKRGEHLATRADFQEILSQVRLSTRASEEVKAEVEAAFGEESAKRALLREKIEMFFVQSDELSRWHSRSYLAACRGKIEDIGGPLPMIQMLQALYFRDLATEVNELAVASSALDLWVSNCALAVIDAQRQGQQLPEAQMDPYRDLRGQVLTAQQHACARLVEVYSLGAGL